MSFVPVLSIAKFLVNIPTWMIISYLAVAAVMTIALLTQFLKNARTRNASQNAWIVLFILMFPLAALSMIWPITLPFAIRVLWKDHKQTRERRGFSVVTEK